MVDKLNKINKATGYKSEKLFWTDVKNKFENAYKQDYKGNNTIKYHISENFSNEIDKALNNELINNTQVKARDYTPSILVNNGVKNLPMLITQKHIKSIVYTLQEAQNLGLPTKNTNYHGLGKDLLIKAIDNLDSPQAIYKTGDDNYLVVTEFKDSNDKEIVVPIQINGKGNYNNVFIDENQIKSVYGRRNLSNYLKNNNFDEIYTKNKESDFNEGIQYSNVADSSITNSIPPSGKDVNTTTKYSMQESGNNSVSKNNNWQTYLDKNYKNTGTGQTVQDVKIAPTAKIELNKVAKNQETLYNDSESESGINGERQNGQRTSGILGELDTRLQQKEKPQQSKKYTRTEYEQWEQSIKPITNSKLTQEQRQLKNNIKRQYGKDIVFFDGNKNDYNGGASLKNTNNIYINRNDVNEFGINKIALHEVLESNIAHNPELKNDIINPTIKTIINDNNFQEQKNKFWEGQEGDIPSDYMIAKDILCDRFSELKSGEKLDYDNVLSQETNMTIDFAIENFEKQLKNSSTKLANNIVEKNKTLNPVEISNLNREDANTTPEFKNKTYEKGNKQSSFLSNITTDAKFLNEDLRQVMSKDENIQCLDMI